MTMSKEYEILSNRILLLESENRITKKCLKELKPILEYYANSTIGKLQPDGRYMANYKNEFGEFQIFYDPTKAKEGLNKVNKIIGD